MLLYAGFLHRLIRFDPRAMVGIYLRSAAVTLAALTPLGLVYLFWAGPATIALPTLLAAVGAGVGLWLATLVLVRHPALDDLVTVIAHLPYGHRLRPMLAGALARSA